MIRYVGLDLLFTSSPLYPPYFTADRAAGPRRPRRQHRRGPAGRRRARANSSSATCSSRRAASCRPASRSARTTRTCRSRATSSAASRASSRSTRRRSSPRASRKYGLPPDANLFLAGAFNQDRFLERRRRLRGGADQLLDAGRADAARLRRRQLARRDAERRVQLRVARHRRGRLRAHDDDDPRVRPSLVDEPPARRLRPEVRASTSSRPASSSSAGSATSRTR